MTQPFVTISHKPAPLVLLTWPPPPDLWLLERASRVFMPESDAFNFFKRRNRRSYHDDPEAQGKSFNVFNQFDVSIKITVAVCWRKIVLNCVLKGCPSSLLAGNQQGHEWWLVVWRWGRWGYICLWCGWLAPTLFERFMCGHIVDSLKYGLPKRTCVCEYVWVCWFIGL